MDNPFIDTAAYIRRLREAWELDSGRMFPMRDADVHVLDVPAGLQIDRDVLIFTTATD